MASTLVAYCNRSSVLHNIDHPPPKGRLYGLCMAFRSPNLQAGSTAPWNKRRLRLCNHATTTCKTSSVCRPPPPSTTMQLPNSFSQNLRRTPKHALPLPCNTGLPYYRIPSKWGADGGSATHKEPTAYWQGANGILARSQRHTRSCCPRVRVLTKKCNMFKYLYLAHIGRQCIQTPMPTNVIDVDHKYMSNQTCSNLIPV